MSRRKRNRRSSPTSPAPASAAPRAGRFSKKKWLIGTAVATLAIVAGLFYFHPWRGERTDDSRPTPIQAAAPPKSDSPSQKIDAQPPQAPAEETAESLAREELATFQQLAADFPNNTNIVGVLGEVYLQRGKPDEAAKCWEACLKIDPRLGTAHHHLAMLAISRADYEQAVRRWRIAVESNPRTPGLHGGLGRALLFQGKAEEALGELAQEIALAPKDYEAYLDQGLALFEVENFVQAKKSLEKAVELNPKHSRVYFKLAEACERLGESTKAEEYRAKFQELKAAEQEDFHRGVSLSEKIADVRQRVAELRTNAGRAYRAGGNLVQAEEHLKRAVQLRPTAANFALLADVREKLGNRDQAAEAWKHALELEPLNERYRRDYESFQQRK